MLSFAQTLRGKKNIYLAPLSSGERTYYFRSPVLGLRLRKVAQVTGPLTAWHLRVQGNY